MWPFSRHADTQLSALLAGTLPSGTRARVLKHLHACPRCADRYDERVRTERVLAQGHPVAPAPSELSLLRDSHLAAALASSEGTPAPRSSKAWMGLLAGGLVTATAVVLILRPPADTWSARGGGEAPSASLRLFCIPPTGDTLVELRGEASCPRGHQLGFGAGTTSPPVMLMLSVRGDGLSEEKGPFLVKASPGQEELLSSTTQLNLSGGTQVEVVASFAPREEAARRGLREANPGVVILRRHVAVSTAP
ncbi:zf-HC2 domain-containing protein [Myxococcus stipitatus]|uniref:anti-sigma factor family protein n=1 Tax=Myxococcus stipitatus TaxID=83455 RepID=UPI003144E2CF